MVKLFKKICPICLKEFKTKSKIRECCSSECSHQKSATTTKILGKNFKRIYSLNDNFLKQDSDIKYYYLGLMASDGNVSSKSNKTISISQSGENGLKLITYIKNILDTNYRILMSYPKKGKCVYSLSIRSDILREDLIANNIVPNKTHIYNIPEYILEDINKLRYFLIGYVDGDGCIGVYKNMLSISFVCSKNMYNQLIKLPILNGAVSTKKGDVIEIRFNGINAVNFSNIIYKDLNETIFKSYKYQKLIEYKNNMFDISPRMKYNFMRDKLFDALDKNPDLNCITYAEQNNIDVKYVYRNRQLWRKQRYEFDTKK